MLGMEPYLNETIERVRKELANHLKKSEGVDLKDLEVVKISNRSFSSIVFLHAKTSKGTQPIVMKKVVHDPINIAITQKQNQAVIEFEILEKLYPKFKEVEGCSVPRPILVIPEIEVFAMEFVEGKPLTEELKYARYFTTPANFSRLKRYYYLCGRWLRHFQEFTGFEYTGVNIFNSLMSRCDIRLKLIEENGFHQTLKDFRNKTLALLQDQLSQIRESEVLVSGRHGDFGHWNIMVNSNGVTIFDFLGYALEPVPYDLLKMLISFETWGNYPAYSKNRFDDLKKNFIKGYGNFYKLPLPVAMICEIYHRVAVIHACIINPGNRFDLRVKTSRTLKENLKRLSQISDGEVIWPNVA